MSYTTSCRVSLPFFFPGGHGYAHSVGKGMTMFCMWDGGTAIEHVDATRTLFFRPHPAIAFLRRIGRTPP